MGTPTIKTTTESKTPIVSVNNWQNAVDDIVELGTEVTDNANDISTLESNVSTLETNKLVTVVTDVDASAGGTAQTTAIATIPAGSLLLNITAITTEAFTGDSTTTAEVGISGNIDAYIDTVDLDVSTLDTQASSLNGTTNDVKTAQYLDAETDVICTWTNDASADAGAVKVITTYVELS